MRFVHNHYLAALGPVGPEALILYFYFLLVKRRKYPWKTSGILVIKSVDRFEALLRLAVSNNVEVETLLIKNCDHHIPVEASSTALNYILKRI